MAAEKGRTYEEHREKPRQEGQNREKIGRIIKRTLGRTPGEHRENIGRSIGMIGGRVSMCKVNLVFELCKRIEAERP